MTIAFCAATFVAAGRPFYGEILLWLVAGLAIVAVAVFLHAAKRQRSGRDPLGGRTLITDELTIRPLRRADGPGAVATIDDIVVKANGWDPSMRATTEAAILEPAPLPPALLKASSPAFPG